MTDAKVTPVQQPWLDGPSTVEPIPAGNPINGVPLKNYMETEVTVNKNDYRTGQVLIVRGNPPSTTTAILPVVQSATPVCTVIGLGTRPYDHGVVVLF